MYLCSNHDDRFGLKQTTFVCKVQKNILSSLTVFHDMCGIKCPCGKNCNIFAHMNTACELHTSWQWLCFLRNTLFKHVFNQKQVRGLQSAYRISQLTYVRCINVKNEAYFSLHCIRKVGRVPFCRPKDFPRNVPTVDRKRSKAGRVG